MFACCAWHQAKDAYAGYLTKLPAEQAGWLRLPRPQVLGGRGMDWLAVEAGEVS